MLCYPNVASLPSNPDEIELDFGLSGLIPSLSMSPIEVGFRTLQLNNGFGRDNLANPEARPNSSTFIFFFFLLCFPKPFSAAIAANKDFHFLRPSSSEAFQPRSHRQLPPHPQNKQAQMKRVRSFHNPICVKQQWKAAIYFKWIRDNKGKLVI
ncbi:hypothetical protein ACFX19_020573 [Malus domestica]